MKPHFITMIVSKNVSQSKFSLLNTTFKSLSIYSELYPRSFSCGAINFWRPITESEYSYALIECNRSSY